MSLMQCILFVTGSLFYFCLAEHGGKVLEESLSLSQMKQLIEQSFISMRI